MLALLNLQHLLESTCKMTTSSPTMANFPLLNLQIISHTNQLIKLQQLRNLFQQSDPGGGVYVLAPNPFLPQEKSINGKQRHFVRLDWTFLGREIRI